MKTHQTVTLKLPVGGFGRDYAGAIALAIGDAGARGDFGRGAALAGLMSAIKLPAGHNPEIELGPWFADIEKATRTVTG